MGDLHLVLPALNLSILHTGILIVVQQIRWVMVSCNRLDYHMSFLSLSTWDILSKFYSLSFFVGPLLHALKFWLGGWDGF